MTGNAAQAIIDPADWDEMLGHTSAALRPGGRFVLETSQSGPPRLGEMDQSGIVAPGSDRRGRIGRDLGGADRCGPAVGQLPSHVGVQSDGAVLTSDSTLRFRNRGEIEHDLERHGYAVDEVRDAPDRPGVGVRVRRTSSRLTESARTPVGSGWTPCRVRGSPSLFFVIDTRPDGL